MRIAILAYDNMNLLDLSGPLQALCTANRGSGRALYETVVVSAFGGLITTSAGLPVMTQPLAVLDGVPVDTIIAAGGCAGDEFHAPPQLAAWVACHAARARRVCSVCTGAFILAAAGQLDGRTAATHWAWTGKLQKLHPRVKVDAERIFIRDGNVWTSAGVSAGIDLALALIEEDYGHRIAIEAARQMVVFIKRSGGQSQFSAPLAAQEKAGGRFAELHAWMSGHLHEQLTVERLAAQAGMAPRTFARTYVAQMGVTPGKMVETMRLEAARRALEETGLPLKSIAARSGYADEQNLRRAFQRHLGISPGQYRNRFSPHATQVIA
ncbi:GlxA family transcriptional regulator [Pseudoduganella rivuli]|uniref:GlxA family transcriptional regulator n=1 Tax=Pseudoduganella rivuli TaxID=2666085 RepID=UPI003FCD8924